MHNILLEIIEIKKQELKLRHPELVSGSIKKKMLKQVQHDSLFRDSITKAKGIALIAEVKFASPTNPNLGSHKDLLDRVKKYEEAGADAISIITEKHFFKGDTKFVTQAKKQVKIPILQKDFVIDEYQIYEAKNIESNALLLIACLVGKKTLQHFVKLCFAERIEPVVEINNLEDLKKAITTSTNIIAVNARNLETFEIDVDAACKLIKKIPDKFIKLGFSGIYSVREVEKYKKSGAKGVLVGTSLMKSKKISDFITSLRGAKRRSNLIRDRHSRLNRLRDDMISVKVKICGIRTLEQAIIAVDAGADFLGFNFVKSSKRYIDPEDAKKIINELRIKNKELRTGCVGVFQDADFDEINKIAEFLNLDFVQLHGEENGEYMKKIRGKIIKKINLDSPAERGNDKIDYVLLDRKVQGQGEMVDIKKTKKLTKTFPAFFSGGLTPENVSNVILEVKPFAVDVAGGIETNGTPDFEKIRQFIKNAKEVDL